MDARMANVLPFLTPTSYTHTNTPLTQTPQAQPPSAVIGDLLNYLENVKEISKRILRDPKIKELQERVKEEYA